jgi:lipopolysaccharide/colanic/teichoic acid biosynthesis glycosyltransferase
MYRKYIKRILDFLISFTAILITLPIMLLVGLSLVVFGKNNIFFIQERPGKDAKIFRVVKFKTMSDDKDNNGKLLPDSRRLTRTGKILRASSLDELPQLFNVLKGDMSLVGPRPLLTDYLPLYNERQARRHDVKPGITGWAQVNGRNSVSWEDRLEMDAWYVENLSFKLDMKIILLTVLKVVRQEGISSSSAATMERFKGSGSTVHNK